MIINDIENYQKKKFPIIIIGSGPAGITLALELEKKKIKSLIIESGNIKQKHKDLIYLKSKTVGDQYADLTKSRLRQFGGSAGIWGGNCNPMNQDNFNTWPIKISSLKKYDNIAKEILELNSKEDFYQKNFSQNLNMYNILWSRIKFNEKYLNHIKKSKFIYLSLNTRCKNLNGSSTKINSIQCLANNKEIKLKSRYFILCAGGIENSRILLWTKEINKKIFNPKMPIGEYYMDHPYYNIGEGVVFYETLRNYYKSKNILNFLNLTCSNSLFLCGNKNFINKENIINAGLYLYFDTHGVNNLFKQIRCVAPKFVKNYYEKLKVKKKFKVSINIMQEQKPNVNNKIVLDKTKDPDDIPYPLIYWKKSLLEKKSARIIAKEISSIFIEHNIGRLAFNENLFNQDNYNPIVGNHQLGGTRMGKHINNSVVDKNLKVHDKNNLFVTGSSVFRTGGHNHPTYTIVKLSARLAEHIFKLVD